MQYTESEDLLRRAKASCKRSNKTLYMLTRIFPKEKRAPTFFIYYYFRELDDLIDRKELTYAERVKFLDHYRKRMDRLFRGEVLENMDRKEKSLLNFIAHNPNLAASMRPYMENLFEIMYFDSEKASKKTVSYNELIRYCYLTGGSPFMMAMSFLDPEINEATKRKVAQTFGVGSELTHILRDFVKDVGQKSTKVTKKETIKFNLFKRGNKNDDGLRKFAKYRVEEAAKFFERGKKYIGEMPGLPLKMILVLYRWRFLSVLKKIEMRNYDLMLDYDKTSFAEYIASMRILFGEIYFLVKGMLFG